MKVLKNFRFKGVSVSEHTVIFGNGIVSVEEDDKQKIYLLQFDKEISNSAEVIPETVEQLICFDDDGKEIFENDFVQDEEKNNYKAVLLPSFWNEKNNSYVPVWRAKKIHLSKAIE